MPPFSSQERRLFYLAQKGGKADTNTGFLNRQKSEYERIMEVEAVMTKRRIFSRRRENGFGKGDERCVCFNCLRLRRRFGGGDGG